MNREIKFRAWDYKNKIMITDAIELTEYKIIQRHSLVRSDNVIWQQYTGLKDLKGNEIYEGDILSDYTETDEGVIKSYCQIFWNKMTGSWHLDNSSKQDKTYSTELWKELRDFKYEIIGNIHEKALAEKKEEKESTLEPLD